LSTVLLVGVLLTLSLLGAGSARSAPRALPQSLTVAYPYPFSTLVERKGAGTMAAWVTEPLVHSGHANKLTPVLATSWSQPNPTTIVFQLRKNVHFSNGAPLTPEDVKWSTEQAFAPDSYLRTFLPNYKSVSIAGPHAVAIHLTKPTPAAVGALAYCIYVENEKYALAHKKDYGTSSAMPIGTGPYTYKSFTTNGVTLTRNDHYWGRKAPFQTVNFNIITQDNTAQLAMRSGSVQADFTILNERTVPQWKSISGASVTQTVMSFSTYVSMDVSKPPFDDVHVRRALAYAIDRGGLQHAFFSGYATPIKSIFDVPAWADTAPSYAAAVKFANSLPSYDFDLAKAKAELAQSRYPHGFTFTMRYYPGQPIQTVGAESLQQTLKSIGVTLNLKPLSLAEWQSLSAPPKNKYFGLLFTQFSVFPEDPVGGLAFLIGKANMGAYGLNYANYTTPEIEKAWSEMEQSTDNAVRWRGVQTILRDIARDVPYAVLYNTPALVVLGDGMTFSGPVYYTDLLNGEWIYKIH
jgi:peptide/nickel transport system substrate-binding protein